MEGNMRYIALVVLLLSMIPVFASTTVNVSDEADDFIRSLQNGENVYRTGGQLTQERVPESAVSSWTETPEYLYRYSGEHYESAELFDAVSATFPDKNYQKMYNENNDTTVIMKKEPIQDHAFFPLAEEKEKYIATYRNKAIEFVNRYLGEQAKQLEFHNYSYTNTQCARCDDPRKKIRSVTIYFRRVLDGAVITGEQTPLQIEISTATGEIMRVRSVWKSYERVSLQQYFLMQSIQEKVDEVLGFYAEGKTGSEEYDEKAEGLKTVISNINIKGGAKSWHKTNYYGEEYFVPSLLFFFEAPSLPEEECDKDSEACNIIPQSLEPIFLLKDYPLITLF